MADIRDAYGNPIQLTDQHGYPVQLTDEFGNPVHITGVATSEAPVGTTVDVLDAPATGLLANTDKRAETVEHYAETHKIEQEEPEQEEPVAPAPEHHDDVIPSREEEVQRSTSSSSSSSEDDGQGGRRKKKGLKQKLKEKLNLGKHKEEPAGAGHGATTTSPAGEHDQNKKSMMEKIKDIFPGHHNH